VKRQKILIEADKKKSTEASKDADTTDGLYFRATFLLINLFLLLYFKKTFKGIKDIGEKGIIKETRNFWVKNVWYFGDQKL
jgi:hypothetical protein